MRIQEIRVTDRKAELVQSIVTPMGNMNVDAVRYVTDEEWNAFTKTVLFTSAAKETYCVVPDHDGCAMIPNEITMNGGRTYSVTLVGVNGEQRLVSTAVQLIVQNSKYSTDAAEPEDVTPTLAEQLTDRVVKAETDVGNAVNAANRAAERAEIVVRAYESGELNGSDGLDGISPTVKITPVDGGHMVTITDKSGEHSAVLKNGKDGADGVSPAVKITDTADGHIVTITDKSGEHSAVLKNGKDGADGYSVTASIGSASGGIVLTVTDKNGPHSAMLYNGKPGTPGNDGFSPTVNITPVEGGHLIKITDKNGVHSAVVLDGVGGGTAEVTKESIEDALGYVPADREDVPEEIGDDEVDAIMNTLGDEDDSIAELIRKVNRRLELIETITFDGSTVAVYRNQTPDGRVYDFEAVRLIARGDDPVMQSGVMQVNGDKLYGGTNRKAVGFSANRQAKYVRMNYSVDDGHFDCASRTYKDAIYADTYITDNVVYVDAVNAIEWQAGGVTPTAGATLEIWGRWR